MVVLQTENCSIVWFSVSNEHHSFLDQIGLTTIIDTLRVSVGKPFGLFGVLWGTLFEALVFTAFEENRVTASNSGRIGVRSLIKQLPRWQSMASLRARTDPEQDPRTQGPTQSRTQGPQG